jgi:zinc transport system ATP-binding protein
MLKEQRHTCRRDPTCAFESDATAASDATASTSYCAFRNASIGYGRRTILCDLDFSIRSGDYLAIVGSNGSGKTTLLRAMLGLLKPLSGSIGAVAGRTLHYGYVPQLQDSG